MAVAVLGGIIFVKLDLIKHYRVVILPTLNGHSEEYPNSIMFLRKEFCFGDLDYVKANCGGKVFCDRWRFTWWSEIAMELLTLDTR